jgi:hypothetical protein
MIIKWIVIWKRDADPPEVYPFEEESQARDFYTSINWSDVYLCEVKAGPKV